MKPSITALCTAVLLVTLGSAHAESSDPVAVWEKRCSEGERADNYEAWQWIANNARRTADLYATQRYPEAVFVHARVEPVFQVAGQYAGQYLVKLVNDGPGGVSFAMLRPNFPFCTDPAALDDSREDLFIVVTAKFNGRHF